MKTNKIYLSGLCVVMLFTCVFSACKKQTEVKTIVETKTDTVIVVNHDTVRITDYLVDSATTFILTRHAETAGSGSDPMLSVIGQQRADTLAKMTKSTQVHAVYATSFNRTKQTAAGVAGNNGLTTQIYDPFAQDALVTQILMQYKSKVVYLAGHSNTIPALLNILTGSSSYTDIPAGDYDNLYIVNVFEKGRASVVHLKY